MAMLFADQDLWTPFWHHRSPGRRHRGCQVDRSSSAPYGRKILVDVKETSQAFQVAAEIPGMQKEDIRLHVDGDTLSLAVEKATEKQVCTANLV